MKKIIVFILSLFVTSFSIAFAADTYLTTVKEQEKMQNHVSEVGFNILNSNGIEKRMIFFLDGSKNVNAATYTSSRTIVVYRGLYNMLQDDDELAAVIGHEISHGVDSYDGIFNGMFTYIRSSFAPKKYEYKADKRAVDYMVNAGYNPVALIVVMNKAFSQYSHDIWSSHPLTSRRMMEVYEYIYTKYPEYLVNNKYKNNIYYQNFLLTSKENRAKFQEKVKNKSTKKVKYQ